MKNSFQINRMRLCAYCSTVSCQPKKYNAEQALAQFAATARDEVDMDKLTAALIGVVQETMQPERVSVGLKEMPENRKQKKAGT